MALKNSLRVYFLPFMVFFVGILAYCALFVQSMEKSFSDLPLLVKDFYTANFTHQATQSLNNQSQAINKAQSRTTNIRTSIQTSNTQEYTLNNQNNQNLLESTQDKEANFKRTSPNTTDDKTRAQDNLTSESIITQATTPNKSAQDSALDSASQATFAKQDSLSLSHQESTESQTNNLKIQTFYINANSVNVRQSNNTNSPITKRLRFGQAVLVESIQSGWAKLDSGGFVSSALLSSTQPTKTFYVATNTLYIREMPSTNAKIIGSLKLNNKVIIKSISDDGWAELSSGGFVSFGLIKESPIDPKTLQKPQQEQENIKNENTENIEE